MKKAIAFLLSAAMGFTVLHYPGLAADPIKATEETQQTEAKREALDENITISIVHDDLSEEPVSSFTVLENEKVELTTNAMDDYYWQIRVAEDTWVKIADYQSSNLIVTRALIYNLLDETNSVQIRVALNGAEAIQLSNPITVTLNEGQTLASDSFDSSSSGDFTNNQPAAAEPVILQDMVIADGPHITEPVDEIINEPQITDGYVRDDYENPSENEQDYSAYQDSDYPQDGMNDADSDFWADADDTESFPDNDLSSNGTLIDNQDNGAVNNDETDATDQEDLDYLSTAGNDDSAYEGNTSNFGWSSLLNLLSPLNTADEDSDNTEPANPPKQEKVSIVVNYVFEDGEIAYSQYRAEVAKGSDFDTTIYPPEIQGYEPSADQRVLNISYKNIQKDETIEVIYHPASVNFVVNYYYQNIEDDNYQNDPNNPHLNPGTTNNAVKDDIGIVPEKKGFIRLPYDETERIAADGSTQVNIYYDRLYFLVLFDMDGGFGTEPVYAKYGAPLSPNKPTKPGYQFVSWKEDGTNHDLNPTVPAKNVTYKAEWKENEKAKVTVVYWGQNPDKYQASVDGEAPERMVDNSYSFLTEKVYEDQTVGGFLSINSLENSLCLKAVHNHNETCRSCNKEQHQHTISQCFQIKNSQIEYSVSSDRPVNPPSAPRNPENGLVYVYSTMIGKFYYIYFNNNWYNLSKKETMPQNGETLKITQTCQKEEHAHVDECYSYSCGKEEHTHDSDCKNALNELLNDNEAHLKWYYNAEKSDKDIQVQPDGSTVINVYFDRVRYNMTFQSDSYKPTTYADLNEKWGTNIHEMFKWVCDEASTTTWNVSKNVGDEGYITYIQVIPLANKIYLSYSTNNEAKAEWYIENLNSDDPENKANYDLYTVAYSNNGPTVNEQETELRIEGFTFKENLSTKNGADFNGAKFYHQRNKYELKFSNIRSNDGSNSKTEIVPFEKSLAEYDSFTPQPPKGLYEEGSVEFAGWYKNKDCSPGAEYDLLNSTMPPANLILYAKWVPVTRHVTFRTSKEMENEGLLQEIDVPHRGYISENNLKDEIKNPTNQNLNFIGWFYEEEVDGKVVEKAFDLRMPVTKDMNLYGKWDSKDLVTYTIFYAMKDKDGNVIKDEKGNIIYIADAEKVSGLHDKTKTVEAKTRNDLYPGYQTGLYPITSSHSITFDITKSDADKTYTFYYIKKDEVEYTVRYLEKGTNKELQASKISKTTDDVITESYAFIQGYMPDKFSKRLILQADGVNEIIFYYSKDTTHAPVVIEYWVRNLEGDGYSLKEHIEENNCTVGSQIKVQIKDYPDIKPSRIKISNGIGEKLEEKSILDIDSYEYFSDNTKLTAQGLHIEVYYERDGRITIRKNVDQPVKSDQVFLFKLSSNDAQDQNININVPIEIKEGQTAGTMTVTSLPIGIESDPIQYTVEELTDWHRADYHLKDAGSTQTIELSTKDWKSDVTFNNYATSHNWFTDSDAIRNTFKQYSHESVSTSEAGDQ